MPACSHDKCSQGRGIPCNREACRNAPQPRIFYWWDAFTAAVEDLPHCYRAKRVRGHGRFASAWMAFDAAVWPIEAAPSTIPGLPIVLIEPSTFDKVMCGFFTLASLLCVAAVGALAWWAWANWDVLRGLL